MLREQFNVVTSNVVRPFRLGKSPRICPLLQHWGHNTARRVKCDAVLDGRLAECVYYWPPLFAYVHSRSIHLLKYGNLRVKTQVSNF